MKFKALFPTLFVAAACILSSCRDEFSNKEHIKQMQDTLFKVYPTMAGVSVDVKDWNNITVVVRSAQLSSTTGENKEKITAEIGNIVQAVFGTNNELEKGQVIFTKDETGTDMNPADGERFPIAIPEK
ncbi:MAG: hypothetical protein JNL72_03505 [Flavipsychrobacter sp.]|nr:hypothetical protein [Flavipsychrobacter sp.]